MNDAVFYINQLDFISIISYGAYGFKILTPIIKCKILKNSGSILVANESKWSEAMSEINKEGDNVLVKPDKNIVASIADEFRNELRKLVQESPREVVIDLAGVEMVDSVGIGILIATHNSLNNAKGELKVINVDKDIYSLFTTMRLDHHFTVEKAE